MKMEEFNKLIEFCDEQYQNSNACNCGDDCANKNRRKLVCESDCYECVKHVNDFNNKTDHYNCHKMALYYVLKHGFRFYPENVILFKEIFSQTDFDNVHVVSIGCGPCTELFGGFQAWRTAGGNDESFWFHGFDLNPIWEHIENHCKTLFNTDNILIETKDAFIHYKDSNEPIDVIVLNYSLSDMFRFRHGEYGKFVNSLMNLIVKKKPQYLLINDVYTKQAVEASTLVISSLNSIGQIKTNIMRQFHNYNEYIGKFGDYVDEMPDIPNFPNIEGIDEGIVGKYDPFHMFIGIQAIIKLKGI